MQKYLCFNPEYEKKMQKDFQEYAISVLYGNILIGSDIVDDYKNNDDSD